MLYYLTKAIIFIIRLIPQQFALPLFSAAGFIVGKFHKKERDISAAQLKFVCNSNTVKSHNYSTLVYRRDNSPATRYYNLSPSLADTDINKIVDANFSHIGKVFYDSLIIDRLTQFKPGFQGAIRFSDQPFRHIHLLDGMEDLEQLTNSDTACFTLSAHFGCFELLAACAAKFQANHTQKRQLCAIGRNPNYNIADRILKEIREQYGVETIWREDKKAGIKLVQTIKRHNWLAVLIDQDTGLQNAFCPFFGLEAAYPIPPISLAVKYAIPIISTFIIREPNNMHLVTTRRIHYDPLDIDVELKILKAYTEHLESVMLEYPEQWVWWHRRWRRRPEGGKPRKINDYIEWLNGLRNE